MDYRRHIHYKVDRLPFEKKRELLYEAFGKCYDSWVTMLDAEIHFSAIRISMKFEEVMTLFKDRGKLTFVRRRFREPFYLEIGLAICVGQKTTTLWLKLEEALAQFFIEKYNIVE